MGNMTESDHLVEILRDGNNSWREVDNVIAAFPQAQECVVEWINEAIDCRDLGKYHTLVNFAVHIKPPGLAEILIKLIKERDEKYLLEDVAEMLGELGSMEAVDALSSLLNERARFDAAEDALCLKCIWSLAAIDTEKSRASLMKIAIGNYPDLLKWHAAYELQIEEELGFDEDSMTGPVHPR